MKMILVMKNKDLKNWCWIVKKSFKRMAFTVCKSDFIVWRKKLFCSLEKKKE